MTKSGHDDEARRILVLGLPRSGTTWVGQVLALAPDTAYAQEPDNEGLSLLGICTKAHLPRFPFLPVDATDRVHGVLWRTVFAGRFGLRLAQGRTARRLFASPDEAERWVAAKEAAIVAGDPLPRPPLPLGLPRAVWRWAARLPGRPARIQIVKSVHAVLSAEWTARVSAADTVLVVLRSPYAMLASMRRMSMPDAVRAGCLAPAVQEAAFGAVRVGHPAQDDALTAQTAQIAAMVRLLETAAARNPAWTVVTHESLCADPVAGFGALFERLRLRWTDAAEQGIAARDRPGSGYVAQRVARTEVGKWRADLSRDEARTISALLEQCGLGHRVEAHEATP